MSNIILTRIEEQNSILDTVEWRKEECSAKFIAIYGKLNNSFDVADIRKSRQFVFLRWRQSQLLAIVQFKQLFGW